MLSEYQTTHKQTAEQLELAQSQLRTARDEGAIWEQLAAEAERAKSELTARLAAQQASAVNQPPATTAALVTAATKAAIALELDEAETRKLIDHALGQAAGPPTRSP